MSEPVRIGKIMRGLELRAARAENNPKKIAALVSKLLDELTDPAVTVEREVRRIAANTKRTLAWVEETEAWLRRECMR